jgi:tRNA G46 methylase TrmB
MKAFMLGKTICSQVLILAITCVPPKCCQALSIPYENQFIPSLITEYTINDDVCPPTNDAVLKRLVLKNCHSLDAFLDHKPIARHTREAFDQVAVAIMADCDARQRPIVLDSGCGTARSSMLLGLHHPQHLIVGIDRSFVRLTKHATGNCSSSSSAITTSEEQALNTTTSKSITSTSSKRPYFQIVSSNVILVRAELADFWRCCLDAQWNVTHHYLLYPNPYPTKARLKQRWYGHPCFPILLQLGGDIVVRSNWRGYLTEFAKSVEYLQNIPVALPYVDAARRGPLERLDKKIAWTNFEQKYDTVGEPTYELLLERGDCTPM